MTKTLPRRFLSCLFCRLSQAGVCSGDPVTQKILEATAMLKDPTTVGVGMVLRDYDGLWVACKSIVLHFVAL